MLSPLLSAKSLVRSDARYGKLNRAFSRLPKPPKDAVPGMIHIMSRLKQWEWSLLEARESLGLGDVAVSAIVPCRWFATKSTSTYGRKYRGQGANMVTEKHESIATGQKFEMKFTLASRIPPGEDSFGRFTRAPDEEEFDAMLTHIGEYLGMSEWGRKLQYGRFEIDPFTKTT